jgi:hypothetical protein
VRTKKVPLNPLCSSQFRHDASSPSPTLEHVHIQKHKKKGIGVQLGNIHQRDKIKGGTKTIHPFLSSSENIWFGKSKRRQKKTSHPSHRLALSIICLVLFLHLESSRPVICVSHCCSDFSEEPFTVLISAFDLF